MYFPLSVSIPEPCHEDWNAMTPVEFNQRHCRACDRVLTDFSNMTDVRIGSHLRRHEDKLCGRFRAGQLDRRLATGGPRRFSGLRAAAASAGLLLSLPAAGQEAEPHLQEQLETSAFRAGHVTQTIVDPASNDKDEPITRTAAVNVTGRIVDDTGEGLIGVQILIKNTTTGTATDTEGFFSLLVSGTEDVTLFVSYTGYVTKTINLTVEDLKGADTYGEGNMESNLVLELGIMEQDEHIMGLIVRRSLAHRAFVAPVNRYVVWPTRQLVRNVRNWKAERRATRPERVASRELRREERRTSRRIPETEVFTEASEKPSVAPATAPASPFELTASPNPFTDHLRLGFTLPEAGPYRVELLTMAGKSVTVWSLTGETGKQEIALEEKFESLTAGSYVVRMTAGVIVETMVIVRK